MPFRKRLNSFPLMLVSLSWMPLLFFGCYRPAPPLEEGEDREPVVTTEVAPDGSVTIEGHPVAVHRQVIKSGGSGSAPNVSAIGTTYTRTSSSSGGGTSGSSSGGGTSGSGAAGGNRSPSLDVDSTDSTSEDTPKVISLRVSDPDGSLTCTSVFLSYTSSAPGVVANSDAVVFGGSWPNCTATITPTAHAVGSTSLKFTITDSMAVASDELMLTVTSVNDAPALSSIADQSTSEDQNVTVNFTLSDVDHTLDCSSTYLTATSSNAALLANTAITYSGTYPNCAMILVPESHAHGATTVTLTVSDGQASDSRSFQLSVAAVNDAPAIADVFDQTTDYKTYKDVSVTISDVDSSLSCASSLSGLSSDTAVLPNANIVFSGTSPNCSVRLTPVNGQTGTATVTFSLSDGSLSAQDSFILTIQEPPVVWAQEAYVKAANAKSGYQFGQTVSLSGDTLAVGSHLEDSNANTITNGTTASTNTSNGDSGAVYVYRRSGVNWVQEAYVKAANSNSGDYFGYSLSLSRDTLAVGAYREDSNQTSITNGTTASTDDSLTDPGAVYIYERSGSSWAQQAYIKAVNTSGTHWFGYGVSLSGDTLAVGAKREKSNQNVITNGTSASSDTSLSDAGAVFVYRRSGVSWAQEAYIKAANVSENLNFGSSISIFGDTLVVGTSAEKSNQTTITNGSTASSDVSLSMVGAVYVYRRSGVQWTQEAYIKAANAQGDDEFGYSVSVSGDTLAASARLEDSNQNTITNGTTASSDNSMSASGAVYLYRRSGTAWSQEAYMKAANSDSSDNFGLSLFLAGNILAVGAHQEDSNQRSITIGASASIDNSRADSGAVYIYRRQGGSWAQEAYMKSVNADGGDYFGYSVALSGDTLAVGATREDSLQTTITNGSSADMTANSSLTNSGAVYVYRSTGRVYDPHLSITSKNSTSITLAWHANLGDTTQVKIAPASAGTTTPVSCADASAITLNAGATTYNYTGLTANQKYGFRVCALDGTILSPGAVIWEDTNP